MTEQSSVIFENTKIDFSVIRSKRYSIGLYIDPYKGLYLRAPARQGVSIEMLSKLVLERAAWVIEKLKQVEELRVKYPKKKFVDSETHLYLGNKYR
jgi:predicted metal-dependent hydrolase